MGNQLILNGFCCTSVGNQCAGMWRHPRDRTQHYTRLGHWLEFARLLERGKMDGIFIADGLGISDVYRGSGAPTIRQGGAGWPRIDPLQAVAAMATVTTHLGLGITGNISAEHPYAFARRLSTLDHFSEGRAGWNIVTGYHESTARNLSQGRLLDHDSRYDLGEEYLEVCYKLWEGSWQPDARAPAGTDWFADPAKVHNIEHHGEHYDVPGCHQCEPSPQRTPLLMQAGASARGMKFAARHAEVVFTGAMTATQLAADIGKLTQALEAQGRRREDVRVVNVCLPVVARTDREAAELAEEYRRYADHESALCQLSGYLGTDLSQFHLDEPLKEVRSNAMQSMARYLGPDAHRPWTVRDLAAWFAFGTVGPRFIGSAGSVADQMLEWIEASGSDGFNLAFAEFPASYEAMVDLLVPELQRRGVFKQEYAEGTLREKLFGRGPLLPPSHAGAAFRHLNSPVEATPSAMSA